MSLGPVSDFQNEANKGHHIKVSSLALFLAPPHSQAYYEEQETFSHLPYFGLLVFKTWLFRIQFQCISMKLIYNFKVVSAKLADSNNYPGERIEG